MHQIPVDVFWRRHRDLVDDNPKGSDCLHYRLAALSSSTGKSRPQALPDFLILGEQVQHVVTAASRRTARKRIPSNLSSVCIGLSSISSSFMGLFTLLFLSAAMSWASVGGSISGTVKDPAGAVLPKAAVTVINTDTGAKRKLYTGNDGIYTFSALPPGHYAIEITVPGFKLYRRTDITLDANSALV